MSTERDKIRAELLKSRPVQSKIVTFFGQQIEIKQLTLGAILDTSTDSQTGLVNILIRYAYIPGTNELIFEDTDEESLKALPFGGDFVTLADAIRDLSNVVFPMQGGSSNSTASLPGPTASPTNSGNR